MSEIKEVDALADFGLTLDHFYSIVKTQVSNLQVNQFIQLQAAAIPLDLSKDYTWFSFGNLNRSFDIRLDPKPVADNLSLNAGAKLSDEYLVMLSDLLALVEFKELDSATLAKIDAMQTRILNDGSRINILLQKRMADWIAYATNSMINQGDIVQFSHWSSGHHATREINELQKEQARTQALISALRIRKYNDAADQAIVDAYAEATSPSARLRYPRFPDGEYGDEAKKFNAVYMAMLADNESSLFANRQLITSGVGLEELTTGTIGSLSQKIEKMSQASSSISTDWSASGSGGWGPFRVSANVNSHEKIKEDFKSAESITVSTKSLQAIPLDARWFIPDLFKHKLIARNRQLFDQYFGENGTLLYYPTHLIVVRGMQLKFTSSQDWQYDYEKDFSTSGSGSAKLFGIGWGANANYSRSEKQQKIERRGHDLILDDGDNIRILGYVGTKNVQVGVDAMSLVGNSLEDRFKL